MVLGNGRSFVEADQRHIAFESRQARHIRESRRRWISEPTGQIWIEIGKAVETLGPRALQVIAHAQVESELVCNTIRVIEIKGVVDLLAGNQSWHNRLTEEVIFHVARIVGISEQEVRKTVTGKARQPGPAKRKRSAGHVGLGVVVASNLQLITRLHCVAAANERDVWADVVLSVAILDKALSLRAHDVIRVVEYTRRGGRPSDGRNHCIKRSRPANFGQIETCVLR